MYILYNIYIYVPRYSNWSRSGSLNDGPHCISGRGKRTYTYNRWIQRSQSNYTRQVHKASRSLFEKSTSNNVSKTRQLKKTSFEHTKSLKVSENIIYVSKYSDIWLSQREYFANHDQTRIIISLTSHCWRKLRTCVNIINDALIYQWICESPTFPMTRI